MIRGLLHKCLAEARLNLADPIVLHGCPPSADAAGDAGDVFLRVPGRSAPIPASRAACLRDSAYFRAMLADGPGWQEAKAPEILCEGLAPKAVEAVAGYLAGGDLPLRASNLVAVTQLADRWAMPDLLTQCMDAAGQLVGSRNVDRLLGQARASQLQPLAQRILDAAWLWEIPVAGQVPTQKPQVSLMSAHLVYSNRARTVYGVHVRWHAPDALRVGEEESPCIDLGPLDVRVTRCVTHTARDDAPHRATFSLRLNFHPKHLPAERQVLQGKQVMRSNTLYLGYSFPGSDALRSK